MEKLEDIAKILGIELEPCPFCTGIDLRLIGPVSRATTHVECNNCHANGPFYCRSEAEAIMRWNAWKS